MLSFMTDYQAGGHPKVMEALFDPDVNLEAAPGYGNDRFTREAQKLLTDHFYIPGRDQKVTKPSVWFVAGGTMVNSLALDAFTSKVGGIVCADTGHVNGHEAGTIERFGHKCIALPAQNGKLQFETVKNYLVRCENDDARYHCVQPEVLYISQPTELGTFYTLDEIRAFRELCDQFRMRMYVDGARLAAAICEWSQEDRFELLRCADAFSVGGTKCGALFGEALLMRNEPDGFFTLLKQHGALMAKGRIIALQFSALFKDGLYEEIGRHELYTALLLKNLFKRYGFPLYVDSPSNQLFVILTRDQYDFLSSHVAFEKWLDIDDDHLAARFVTGWSTTESDFNLLEKVLMQYHTTHQLG